jgi:arabinose-5-phosphate isomerase
MYKQLWTDEIEAVARQCVEREAEAVCGLLGSLDESFDRAAEMILACKGRVIVSGVGKSGHVGQKIAACMASVGIPAFFVHSCDGLHGDLGIITSDDVVILISYSGETAEVLALLPFIREHQKAAAIAITGRPDSTLGRACDVVLDIGVRAEADPRGLAPTSSAIATLALGDALAMAISLAKGFTSEDFGHRHPGGSLGKQLKDKRR